MTAIPIPTRATTHGKRGSAGNLPAGGAARLAPPSGRAATDSIPQHPEGRNYGTMGPEWIADQIRRADGFDPDDYARRRDEPAPFADLRDGGLVPASRPGGIIGAVRQHTDRQLMLDVVVSGLSVVALILSAAFALFMIGACIIAPEWLAGWV